MAGDNERASAGTPWGPAAYRDYVSYRLEWVSKLVRAEADKIYRTKCGLDIRQLRVLRIAVEQPGRTVSEIVERAMFDRTLVSRLISQLVAKGMLLRRICDDDARQFRIEVTRAGRAAGASADRLGDKLNEDLLTSLNAAERKIFDRCLEKLMKWRPRDGAQTVAADDCKSRAVRRRGER
jgi:DNA-binding MarR family transcriptional regulator